MSKTEALLSIDIGSSSVRALLFDVLGNPLEEFQSKANYQMNHLSDGRVEVDPDFLFRLVIEQIDALAVNPYNILAVGVSTFWHSLICLDKNYKPLTPLISWNDTRSRETANSLKKKLDEIEFHKQTGCRFHAAYWPAKILWLRAHQPEIFSKTCYFASFSDYFYLKLFGQLRTSISMASATGLFDQEQCCWSSRFLNLIDIDLAFLPEISDNPYTRLVKEFQTKWPMLAKSSWYPAIGDGAASSIGSDCFDSRKFTLMIGTSAAMRAIINTNSPLFHPALWSYRIDRQRRIVGGALSNGGNLFAWMKEVFKISETEIDAVAQIAPDSHGLTILPLFSGERSPNWNDAATAVFAGLRLSTTRTEILRAGLEAVALQIALIYEEMKKLLGEPKEIISTGGALFHSKIWNQIIADALGKDLHISPVSEASCRGVALLLLENLKLISLDKSYLEPSSVVSVTILNHQLYKKALLRQKTLYQAIAENNFFLNI